MGGIKQSDGSDITKLYGGTLELKFDPAAHEYLVKEGDGGEWVTVPSVTRINGATSDKPELIKWAARKSAEWFTENTSKVARDFQEKRGDILKTGDATWQKDSLSSLYEDTCLQLLDEVRIAEWSDRIRWAHRNSVSTAQSVGTVAHKFAEDFIEWKMGKGGKPLPPMNKSANAAAMAFVKWFNEYKVEFKSSESRVYSRRHAYAGTMDIEAMVGGELCICDLKTSKDVYEEHLLQVAAYAAASLESNATTYTAGWIIRIDKESGNFKAVKIPGTQLYAIADRYGNGRAHYETLEMLKDILSAVKKAGKVGRR